MPQKRVLSSSDEDVYHVGSCNLFVIDRLELTDHERVAYDRGHNQRASERRRGVGQ
jgi:hypothetical protein